MANPIKRLHYFDHQFLREDDFTDEQEYHIEMRRRHNRLLHTFGVAEGLDVQNRAGETGVTITPGTAYDSKGQEIVLTEEMSLALTGFAPDADVFVTIAYHEEKSDTTDETGATGDTRVTESPQLVASTSAPTNPNEQLILARVHRKGTAISSIDRSSRSSAGVVGGDLEVRSLTLTDPSIARSQWSILRMGEPRGRFTSLQVTGNLDVTGTVNGRDVGTELADLESHLKSTHRNPHFTSADDVGALSKMGGSLTGDLSIDGRLFVKERVQLEGSITDGFVLRAWNAESNANWSVLARITTDFTSAPSAFRAAVAGVSSLDNVHGLYASANSGTHALVVNGTSDFFAIKNGYVGDLFINGSHQNLQTGDVVGLKGTPVIRFHGDRNSLPVAEVVLCTRENDSRVIGVVDREAIPHQDSPDVRVGPEDPTFIVPGGELYVVTLGVYAHCKADATDAPIDVGDLLTSSGNPGHAKKADNPKLGTIIGKALEPLNEGTGYIAVFVNMH